MTPTELWAQQTHDAQDAYEAQLCAFFKAQRRSKTAGKATVSPRVGLYEALDRYEAALTRELDSVQTTTPNLHPGPLAANAAHRARMMARGTARLALGVPLALGWASVGQWLLPEMPRAQLGHFALQTCCAGGAADLKRANAKAHVGLQAKRDYQRKQAEHRAWLAGTFGPLDAPVSTEYRVDAGPAANPE